MLNLISALRNGIYLNQSGNGFYIWEFNHAGPSSLLFHIADCYGITGSDRLVAKCISRSQVNLALDWFWSPFFREHSLYWSLARCTVYGLCNRTSLTCRQSTVLLQIQSSVLRWLALFHHSELKNNSPRLIYHRSLMITTSTFIVPVGKDGFDTECFYWVRRVFVFICEQDLTCKPSIQSGNPEADTLDRKLLLTLHSRVLHTLTNKIMAWLLLWSHDSKRNAGVMVMGLESGD